MIAVTDQVLNHLLATVSDVSITKAADDTISQYSIETLEAAGDRGSQRIPFGKFYQDMQNIKKNIENLIKILNMD